MSKRSPWTLARALALTLAALALLLTALIALLLRGWQRSLEDAARSYAEGESRRVAELVEASLDGARTVLEQVETRVRIGAARLDDRSRVEADLLALLLSHTDLSELTFTHARRLPGGGDGTLHPAGRWQVSVFWPADAEAARVLTREVVDTEAGFVSRVRARVAEAGAVAEAFRPQGSAPDPTGHPTFVTPFARFYGRAIWTDLHHSQLDSHLPEPRRRVAVSVMKTVEDARGDFAGVLRVGLLTRNVDALIARENRDHAPLRLFICDEQGRLVTRGVDAGTLHEQPDQSLRVSLDDAPPELRAALDHPAVGRLRRDRPLDTGSFEAGGETYQLTLKLLAGGQDWRVGVVVPESYYLGALLTTRNRLMAVAVAVLAGAVVAGALTLRSVRRGLAEIVGSARRMAGFDFAPVVSRSGFRDVQDVMASVELAKTALRALSRYVPVDLVRHLYQTRREPVLGGELTEVTLLFSDIEDFTRLAERLEPNELARLLGLYLAAMTRAVHESGGVIDKYIGDAVMAAWNAASPSPGHPARACRAVLACQEATRVLFESAEWGGQPPLTTRFGVHRDRVMVGHFGAPDRMSFTALGDGVNLASRLEGLNKVYGTHAMVSESVHDECRDGFAFRLLDRVAVKGKTRSVRVYELLGGSDVPEARRRIAAGYEQALAAYWARDFTGALELIAGHSADPPSAVLAERCRRFLSDPPPSDWDGIHTASSK